MTNAGSMRRPGAHDNMSEGHHTWSDLATPTVGEIAHQRAAAAPIEVCATLPIRFLPPARPEVQEDPPPTLVSQEGRLRAPRRRFFLDGA
jgi:hypothetical protein